MGDALKSYTPFSLPTMPRLPDFLLPLTCVFNVQKPLSSGFYTNHSLASFLCGLPHSLGYCISLCPYCPQHIQGRECPLPRNSPFTNLFVNILHPSIHQTFIHFYPGKGPRECRCEQDTVPAQNLVTGAGGQMKRYESMGRQH